MRDPDFIGPRSDTVINQLTWVPIIYLGFVGHHFPQFIFGNAGIGRVVIYIILCMTIYEESTIGKKGEILPKKNIREIMNLKPGDNVILEANSTELVIKKIYSIDELLKLPRIGKGTPQEHKQIIRQEMETQENRSD